MSKSKLYHFIVLVLACLGAALSIKLALDHYQFLGGGRAGDAFCNVSNFVNCDAVAASPYSEFAGFTVAAFGLIFYFIVAIVGFALVSDYRKTTYLRHRHLLWWLALIGVALSVEHMYISFAKVGAVCVLCMTQHAINFLLFGLATFGDRNNMSNEGLLRFPVLWLANLFKQSNHGHFGSRLSIVKWLVVFVVVFALVLSWDASLRKKYLRVDAKALENVAAVLKGKPQTTINLGDSPSFGAENPEILIFEFSDFGCPFCSRAAFISKAVLREFESRVRLVFKHYPLDSECNAKMERSVHPYACKVARGSICAQEQSAFWQYHDNVFSLGERFTIDTARAIAKDIGLDMDAFDKCIDAPSTHSRVVKDIQDGQRAGVESTPTFFFDGRKIAGMVNAQVLKHLIQESLTLANKN